MKNKNRRNSHFMLFLKENSALVSQYVDKRLDFFNFYEIFQFFLFLTFRIHLIHRNRTK
ncbi:hypothetical protein Cpin_0743 [Chitinophaga pinensis DSM 2588]|uniref:Uncharacterized protein n=1 Tax=Chitinophaga pinensis (strain ATCC 43595 / DSM 2588 / LMG 13176 / NBRC 15968 / NCIMB 11800 / UQM 2034) TaxID=485918 RepID=A0A979G022_CHIPD|nr:hypothetical protein Cpin_0743 [Chitinophaga pinensis DSM 2588]